jgi:hypothetical protein
LGETLGEGFQSLGDDWAGTIQDHRLFGATDGEMSVPAEPVKMPHDVAGSVRRRL